MDGTQNIKNSLQLQGILVQYKSLLQSQNWKKLCFLISLTAQQQLQLNMIDILDYLIFQLQTYFYCNKQIKNKVIAFTLPQYIEVIRKLFELLQIMKEQQIQHGNLTMENVLLDFTQSEYKLDSKPVEITFQLKLINFAQFYNLPIKDDLERLYQIYNTIIENFPKYKNELDHKHLYETQQDLFFLESLEQIIYKFNTSSYKDYQKYCWDSNSFLIFQSNYKKYPPLLNNFNQINYLVQQLHQYHIIVNHYEELIYSYLNSWFYKQPPYTCEPQCLIKACSFVDQIYDLNLINSQNVKLLMGEESFNMAMETYKKTIQEDLIQILKKQCFLKNITIFLEIDKNIKINNFKNEIFLEIIQNSHFDLKNIQLQDDIPATYVLSQIIINRMSLFKIIELLIHSSSINLAIVEVQLKEFLMGKLSDIKTIGLQQTKILIDHSFNLNFGKQFIDNKQYAESLIQLMVQGWLKWVDYFIVHRNIRKLEVLCEINNELFIEFVYKEGFKLLKEEMKNIVLQIMKELLNRFNQNPLIIEQIEFIKRVVHLNYSNNYISVKDALCDQLIVQYCETMNQNEDIAAQIKRFNENLEKMACQCLSSIREQYQNESNIANNAFKENWLERLSIYNSQPLSFFKYYTNQFRDEKIKYKSKYLNLVQFEPQQKQDAFYNHCKQVFNKLFNGPIQGLETLNSEILERNAKAVQDYADKKYQSMLLRLSQQYENDLASIDWEEMKKIVFIKFYEQWREGMSSRQIDELLNLEMHEEQIHSTTKDFIELASQKGHNYLFDEEYHMINQITKTKPTQSLGGSTTQSQVFSEIQLTLESDLLIDIMKKMLIEKLKDLIPKQFTINGTFNGLAIQTIFNHIRCSLWEDEGNCSFYYFLNKYQSDDNLTLKLLEYFPQNPEQALDFTQSVQKRYDSVLIWIRNQFKKYISDEYQKVVDENDQLFLEIVHPPNSQDLDQDQIAYLEKQIDNYQKARYLEWLNSRWNKYKEETQKHENIDEDKWKISFYALQSEIQQSISNKLSQLDLEQSLEAQFRKQWIRNCEPKVIVAFVDIFEEWE